MSSNAEESESETKNWVDEYEGFEDILQVIDPRGKFQKMFLYGFLCPLSILYSLWGCLVYVYFIPKHWCDNPYWEEQNYSSYEEWKNSSIPMEMGAGGKLSYSGCKMYENGEQVDCKYGWKYDTSEIESSIPSDYDWVCDKQKYTTIIFTVSGIAGTIGTIFLGPIIDKYGRRRIFVIFTLVDHIAGIIRLFTPKYYWVFLALSVFTSLIGGSADIIVQELTDSEFRSWISATTFTVYVFGLAAVPAIVYLVRNWLYIALITIVPRTVFLIFFIIFFYIPESPRWLISHGRTEEAKTIIKKVAKINGTLEKLNDAELDASLIRLAENSKKNKTSNIPFVGMITLLRRPRIAKHAILLALVAAANWFIYGGITMNTPYMPGNQFLTFFFLAIVEMPSSILGGYLMQVYGRRFPLFFFLVVSAIACFVAAIYVESPILLTICIIISKFSINLTCLVCAVLEVEIFPTLLRGTGSSFTAMLAQTLNLGMPTIIHMGREDQSISYYAFFICSVVGLTCTLFLPETLHANLPDTLDEANEFGKDQSFWNFSAKKSKKRNFLPVSSVRSLHYNAERRSTLRRESVSAVTFVSQVHPTTSISRNRRQSIVNFVGQ